MKKVNFKKIKTRNLDGTQFFIDISKDLGNLLFRSTGDRAMFDKSGEIYHKGEVELTDGQVAEIRAILEGANNPFTVVATDATLRMLSSGPGDDEPEGPDLPPKEKNQ